MNIKQSLLNAGINAFGLDLVCESLLKHPQPIPIAFFFPINRSDCDGWSGVNVQLEPIRSDGEAPSETEDVDRLEMLAALEESIKLQSHYAELLNMHDGGERRGFESAAAWINRLRECREMNGG